MILTLSLVALFFGGVYETVITGLRVVQATLVREQLRAAAASALERLVRDLSLANNVDAAQDARFQVDTSAVNDVDYRYDSSAHTLTRSDASVAIRTVLRNVTAFDFDYVDSAGASLTTPVSGASEDTIRVVQVQLTVASGSEQVSMAAAVYLRNM